MSEMNRVQRWRQQQREAGKDALTIWLPRALKLFVEDIALKRHCSPSDLVEQALTTCYPLSADVADTVTDTHVTDMSQIRLMLQQELRAFLGDRHLSQGIAPAQPVTDTVTDISVQAEAVRAAIEIPYVTDTVTDTQSLPVAEGAMDHQAEYVTDTVTDTHIQTQDVTAAALEIPLVTDTVTVTETVVLPMLAPVTDTVTDTTTAPTAKRKTPLRQGHVTAPVSDTVTVTEAKYRGRKPVLRPGILALLDEHPDGLTAAELKVYLGTAKPIGDTLAGMVKAALLVKTGSGHAIRYQLAEATPL